MYTDQQAVTAQTKRLAGEGVRLLNFWRLASDEMGHALALLDLLDLPQSAVVADLGSGTGEFARIALAHRPDLRFTLVNDHRWQLEQSPPAALRVEADMARTGLAAGGFDAVVLAYALGHGEVAAVLEEAHRLLKPGGRLLVHDMYAPASDAARFQRDLDYTLHPLPLLEYWASIIGFDAVGFRGDTHLAPGATVREVAASGFFEGVQHGALLLVKSERPHRLVGRRAALQFSGGKDSLACLYLLRPFLDRLTVYRLDTGDTIPETDATVAAVRAWIPNYVEITSDVAAWREEHGVPSDLVPAHSHWIGRAYGMGSAKISNRFDCCWNNLMRPMHERARADGVDLVIRGTKLADTGRLPAEGWVDGIEIWLPLRDFTHEDVFAMLRDVGAPISPVYEFATGISAPECMGCTAWWDDKKAQYLKQRHPKQYTIYQKNLRYIADAIAPHLRDLAEERT